MDEPDETAQISVYSVTGSKLLHRDDAQPDPPLKDPASVSRRDFRLALQDSIANPVYEHVRGGRPPARTPELDLYIGAKEVSQVESEGEHHHAVLKFHQGKHRFLPFKLAMRRRHGLATVDSSLGGNKSSAL